jgi:hypothetical protein
MSFGVLMIRDSRRYDFDNLRSAYVRSQFAERVDGCLGNEIVIYQSRSRKYQPGYFAVATLLDADISVQQLGYI